MDEELRSMLTVIIKEIRYVKDDVQELKEGVKVLKEDVSVLKEDVKVLKEDVDVLKGDVKVLKEDVDVLKGDVKVLKDNVDVLKAVSYTHLYRGYRRSRFQLGASSLCGNAGGRAEKSQRRL